MKLIDFGMDDERVYISLFTHYFGDLKHKPRSLIGMEYINSWLEKGIYVDILFIRLPFWLAVSLILITYMLT